LQKEWRGWFVYTLKLGIEGAVVKLDAFDNGGAFDVVVIYIKLKIKDFDVLLLKQCD